MCVSEWLKKRRMGKNWGDKKGAQMEGQGRGDQTQLPWQQMEADAGAREGKRRVGVCVNQSMIYLTPIKRMSIQSIHITLCYV